MAPEPDPSPVPGFAPAAAITALHTAAFFPDLLRALQGVVAHRGAFVTRLFRDRKPGHIYDDVRAERRQVVVDQYLDSAYLLDPIYNAFRQGTGDTVLRLRDVAPDHFRRSTYFKHYYGNIDLGDELAILIDMPDGSAIFISLGRSGAEGRFATRDLRAVRRDMATLAALVRKHFDRPPAPQPALDMSGSIEAALDSFGAELLTAREREVAALILRGHSSRSIAGLTGTTEGTVKIHRKNLYRKLRISSQSELLAKFLGTVIV